MSVNSKTKVINYKNVALKILYILLVNNFFLACKPREILAIKELRRRETRLSAFSATLFIAPNFDSGYLENGKSYWKVVNYKNIELG